MTTRASLVLVSVLIAALGHPIHSRADTLKIGDKVYENVKVVEDVAQYYITVPSLGRTLSVTKEEVQRGDAAIIRTPTDQSTPSVGTVGVQLKPLDVVEPEPVRIIQAPSANSNVQDPARPTTVPEISVTVKESLWNGTEYGMSPESILNLFPNATEVKDHLIGHNNGDIDALMLADFVIADEHFEVRFFFKDSRLTRVRLGFNGDQKPTWTKLESVSKKLTQLLRSKYGPEKSDPRMPKPNALTKTVGVYWMSGSTTIRLGGAGIQNQKLNVDTGIVLALSYEGVSKNELDKI